MSPCISFPRWVEVDSNAPRRSQRYLSARNLPSESWLHPVHWPYNAPYNSLISVCSHICAAHLLGALRTRRAIQILTEPRPAWSKTANTTSECGTHRATAPAGSHGSVDRKQPLWGERVRPMKAQSVSSSSSIPQLAGKGGSSSSKR